MHLYKRDDPNNYVVANSIVAVFLILLGLLLVMKGFRVYRIAIVIVSALFLAVVCSRVAILISPNITDTAFWLLFCISGIIGGFIGYTLYKFCLVLLGALSGVFIAFFILQLKQPYLIDNEIGRIVFVVIFAIIGAILIIKLEKIAFVCATSIIGSYKIMFGIDLFAQWGFSNLIMSWKNGNTNVQPQNDLVYLLIAGFVITSIAGIVIQHRDIKK